MQLFSGVFSVCFCHFSVSSSLICKAHEYKLLEPLHTLRFQMEITSLGASVTDLKHFFQSVSQHHVTILWEILFLFFFPPSFHTNHVFYESRCQS